MTRMSDERMIRAENLRFLMKQLSLNKAEVARVLGTSDTYVNKLLSGKPGTFGEKAARKVEEKFRKTRFWLDSPQTTQANGDDGTQEKTEFPNEYSSSQPTTPLVLGECSPLTLSSFADQRVTRFPLAPVLQWARLGEDLYRANSEWPTGDLKAVPTTRQCSDKIKWVPVIDDALSPKIIPGDLIAIDPHGKPQSEQVALFLTADGQYLFRRYQPLANGNFEAIDSQGRALDSDRHGLTCVGSFAGLFRDVV